MAQSWCFGIRIGELWCCTLLTHYSRRKKEGEQNHDEIFCDNKRFPFLRLPENVWWVTIRFWKQKLTAFSRTSHLRKMIRTEKQSLSFVMDLPQLLLFFYVFYFYFSSSGNFHEAWTHRRTTIIMAVSGKLILTIIQISNWNESQIQRFDSMSVTFC